MTDTTTPWTLFWDMHSGGGTKEEPFDTIYIEAPQAEAELIFYNRFGHSPNRVSCTCCGDDYSVSEKPTLAEASAYHRGCDFDKASDGYVERPSSASWGNPYMTLDEYIAKPDVLIVRADEVLPDERTGVVPTEGYVWQ